MLHFLPLPLFFLGLTALYLGERTFAGTGRWVVDGIGAAALLATLIAAALRWQSSQSDRRRAHGWLVATYLAGLCSVAVYGVLALEPTQLSGHTATLLRVVWPALLLLALFPAVAMELAIGSMERTPTLEIWRVRLASRSAAIMGLALIAFAGLNFTANTWNRKIDLAYFKTAGAGTSTLAIAKNLTQPVQIVLFFPPGNEVLEQVRSYANELTRVSDHVTVEMSDQALDPERAKKLKVRSNGTVALTCGERSETLRLDLDPEEARGTLRNLDAEMQMRLLKVIRPPRVAYFTTGHNERDHIPSKDDKRLALMDLKQLLDMQGFSVRRLGLAEGLGNEVPKDATLVFVMGPADPLQPAERDALRRYLGRGGRVLVAIDPETGVTEDELLAPLGVAVSKALVATDRYGIRIEGRHESPYDMVTMRGSESPIVSTLQQYPGRLSIAFLGAGAVTKVTPQPPDTTVTMALHSMPGCWLDKNGNGKFDPDSEQRANWEVAATVERAINPPKAANPNTPSSADPNAAGMPKAGESAPPMRLVVVTDVDFAANGVLRNPGNQTFMQDIVRWLAGDEKNAGIIESEADVPLVHRKDDDAVWFYGSSFLIPAAVLMGGLTYTRRTSRGKRR